MPFLGYVCIYVIKMDYLAKKKKVLKMDWMEIKEKTTKYIC